MSSARRPVHFNPAAKPWTVPNSTGADLPMKFHQGLPGYNVTPLISLDQVAEECGVGAVYLKDESSRLSLPSFKILGASWGVFRAISREHGIPLDAGLQDAREAVQGRGVTLFAATDGNHGRAVARMGSLLGVAVEIHVPCCMHKDTIDFIESEGATVVKSAGGYEAAIQSALQRSREQPGGILIQDTAFEGYEDIPGWIVEGYSTMLRELDDQIGSRHVDLVITPVGVGSFAQAVVSHFKSASHPTASILTVEPDTAACLWKSLRNEQPVLVETTPTNMAGMDCGAVSSIAWPLLKYGVDASLTVSDHEAHEAVQRLVSLGVEAGPCGASPLAALRRLSESDRTRLGLTRDSTVVLLCTEGARQYEAPRDVSFDDPVALTQALVRIDSSSPTLGSTPGPGETAIALYIKAWLEHRDIESYIVEPTKGRPSVVGVVRGTGGGKSLILNGHIDTVTCQGYDDDPLSGHIADGRLYGRGAADMKAGVAAAMVALINAKASGLRGDVIFMGVADEEDASLGTQQVLDAGWTADAAIVSEPVNVEIISEHLGFVWVEVNIHGAAAHGSRPDLGVDAICKAGHFLVALEKYGHDITHRTHEPGAMAGSVHASLINGGEEPSSYPACCTVTIERRATSTESPYTVLQEIEQILSRVASQVRDFKYNVRVTFSRPSFAIARDDPFLRLVQQHVGEALGHDAVVRGERFWTDCALLAEKGIKALLWGPAGGGLHAKEEWVDVRSVQVVAKTLGDVAREYCA
ncbi:hypothetical protein NLU13_2288 [Sarocladium strictum]|uniref:Succinyl-diaminopimelate desuccinylase n=1 Tax=Sarocladium strictum TaxID=5046 RepID=A0AA39LD10_SARSR|nr:hypothetical protein NLU13_2288 [Sarocladium strictum]